jgi:hypothetical protein
MKQFLSIVATFAIGTSATLAASGTPNHPPTRIDDGQVQVVNNVTMGGAEVLPTTRTIPHWSHSILNPDDGVTYGFNMVGADPYSCSGLACDFTIEVDITPIILNVDGMTFSGADVVGALLSSPVFATNNYGSTPFASQGTIDLSTRGPGGPLSQADAGQLLQLQDATMRAEFNLTGGASNYHFRLHPNILPSVTINVPGGQGVLFQNSHGLVFAAVDIQWWAAQLHNLLTKNDPTHLALYMTDDVLTYYGTDKTPILLALGFHGANNSLEKLKSNGNAVVHTYAWATWMSPGLIAEPNGGLSWNWQDIITVAHEISEWANDPFINNFVEQWSVEGFCSSYLETGDPVNSAGFAMGTNTFRQGPNPDGTQSADGYYHPQDEAFLPWFMRLSPNNISEPTQKPSPRIGRYTFMGDLNTFGFNKPASGCPAN